eukprot:GFUD01003082.1.p1 GENE.GFUD01003082.1~~GFUD01003082.1.p1  ORF type:complete len:545 (-),score=88.68 GFUD01003082.1:58-1692(-)
MSAGKPLQMEGFYEIPNIKLIVLEDVQSVLEEGDQPNFTFVDNNVQCNLCGKVVQNSKELIEHWQLEMSEKNIKIKSEDSDMMDTLEKDIVEKEDSDTEEKSDNLLTPKNENEEKVFRCKYDNCGYDTMHSSLLYRHIKYIHERIRYDCTFCDVKGIGRDGLRKHFIRKHKDHNFVLNEHRISQVAVPENKEYLCTYINCDFKARNNPLLQRHIKHVHELIRYDCTFCDVKGIGRDGLRKHFIRKHKDHNFVINEHRISQVAVPENNEYLCTYINCDFKARNNPLLQRHNKNMHEGVLRPFLCEICDKFFAKEYRLKEHIKRVHEKKRTFLCDMCDKSYADKTELGRHMAAKHDINAIYFNCEKCEYKSVQKGNLRNHMKSHADESDDSFFCEYCAFSTRYKQTMKTHVDVKHFGVKFNCDQCSSVFFNKQYRDQHVRKKHEGASYKCDQCEYDGFSNTNLREHKEVVHEGKRYKCKLCEYQTTSRAVLSAHKKAKHENIRFNCTHCQYSASFMTNLRKHIKTNHPNDIEGVSKPDFCETTSIQ